MAHLAYEKAQKIIEQWCKRGNPEIILNLAFLNLEELPPLPPSIQVLYCCHNPLTELPPLPPSLQELDCSSTQITHLPPLPSSLRNLCCYNTFIPEQPTNPLSDFIQQHNMRLINARMVERCLPILVERALKRPVLKGCYMVEDITRDIAQYL